jgi:hypothetical protein
MDIQLPFIISLYQEDHDEFVKVEVFVPTLLGEFFNVDIIDNGKKTKIETRMPSFFTDESRVLRLKEGVAGSTQTPPKHRRSNLSATGSPAIILCPNISLGRT